MLQKNLNLVSISQSGLNLEDASRCAQHRVVSTVRAVFETEVKLRGRQEPRGVNCEVK